MALKDIADSVQRVGAALAHTLPTSCIPPEFDGYEDMAIQLILKLNAQGLILSRGPALDALTEEVTEEQKEPCDQYENAT